MTIKQQFLNSEEELAAILKSKTPILFLGSRTSTVIPYDRLEGLDLLMLVDSSKLNPVMAIENDLLEVSGAVNWKDAKSYAQAYGRTVMTSPTEELAQILSGVATSCTGERCFGFGTLKDQISELTYMDAAGEVHSLCAEKSISEHDLFQTEEASDLLKRYQESYSYYKDYKNAPFPRLEKETDLLVGTEGQLGIVLSGKFKTVPSESVVFLFFALPKWEEDYSLHLELYNKVQKFRDSILSCELIDENSWGYLDAEDRPVHGKDTIFLEIRESELEILYEELISQIEGLNEEDVFSMVPAKCHELRMKIPRAIFERNSQMGVVKKGTDVQAIGSNFPKLLDLYRSMASKGIGYNLFGHFGDAHLHFNYMPTPEQTEECGNILENFYGDVLKFKGSPFAEHGIGLLKQRFIRPFLSPVHYEMFQFLKDQCDPDRLLFPQGFMSLKADKVDKL